MRRLMSSSVLALLVSACGGSTENSNVSSAMPLTGGSLKSVGEHQAQQAIDPDEAHKGLSDAFRSYLQQRGSSDEAIMIDTRKTDGQPINVAGAQGYRMYMTAQMILPRGYRPECAQPGAQLCILYAGLKPTRYRTTLNYRGNVDLSKSESGWRVETINFNFDQPVDVRVAVPPPPDSSMLAGTWRFNTMSEVRRDRSWGTEELRLTVSGTKVSGTLSVNGPVEGTISENRITLIARPRLGATGRGYVEYFGTLDRAEKTMSGRWAAGMGNRGEFDARREQ